MPRTARVVIPGYPYHITQRGNYGQNVFRDDADREKYLKLIVHYSNLCNLEILGYCIMDNHVHFIAVPGKEDSLARTFSTAHTRYSQYYNEKMKAMGHLWQGRFYSCVLDERHLIAAARYIERNPVRAGIVKKPAEYSWSSARGHVRATYNDFIDASVLFGYTGIGRAQWEEFIDKSEEMEAIAVIRKHTKTGRPLGCESFLRKLEEIRGIRLHALPVGRPKKILDKK